MMAMTSFFIGCSSFARAAIITGRRRWGKEYPAQRQGRWFRPGNIGKIGDDLSPPALPAGRVRE
jgi:hypothetical protein